MNKNLRNSFILGLIFSSLLCSPCSASSTSTQETVEKKITISMSQFNELNTTLNNQEIALEEALNLIIEANIALDQSTNDLIESQEELTKLKNTLSEARKELTAQKKEISELKNLLASQKNELEKASNTIDAANKYLTQAKAEWEASEKLHLKKENSLRHERTFWQILSVVLGGVIAGKS